MQQKWAVVICSSKLLLTFLLRWSKQSDVIRRKFTGHPMCELLFNDLQIIIVKFIILTEKKTDKKNGLICDIRKYIHFKYHRRT